MVSLATMIARLEGMLGTADLTTWEQDFVRRVSALTATQRRTGQQLNLSPRQVELVDELHNRYFG